MALLCGIAAPLAAQEASIDAPAAAGEAAIVADDAGQIQKPAPAPPTPEHTGLKAMFRQFGTDLKHLPSKENLFWAGVGGATAAAVHPLDSTANQNLSGPFLDKFFKPGAILGESYTLLPVSVTIYAIGRWHGNPKVSHMGSDLIQSILIAELMTVTIKYTVRRERPDGSGANSFPSGHAADTMAFATALERHFNWKFYVPAYLGATYVAISRLHDNVHFASDVAFGAAVGIIAGRTVTRTGHPPFPVQVTSVPGGFAILYTKP